MRCSEHSRSLSDSHAHPSNATDKHTSFYAYKSPIGYNMLGASIERERAEKHRLDVLHGSTNGAGASEHACQANARRNGCEMASNRGRWLRDWPPVQGGLGAACRGRGSEQHTCSEDCLADAPPPPIAMSSHVLQRDGEKDCVSRCSAASKCWEDIRTSICTAPTGRALMPWR